MRLSAGNLPLVGLPAVTTKVCPLQGQMVCMTRLSEVDTPACNMSSLRDLKTSRSDKISVASVASVRDKKYLWEKKHLYKSR